MKDNIIMQEILNLIENNQDRQSSVNSKIVETIKSWGSTTKTLASQIKEIHKAIIFCWITSVIFSVLICYLFFHH